MQQHVPYHLNPNSSIHRLAGSIHNSNGSSHHPNIPANMALNFRTAAIGPNVQQNGVGMSSSESSPTAINSPISHVRPFLPIPPGVLNPFYSRSLLHHINSNEFKLHNDGYRSQYSNLYSQNSLSYPSLVSDSRIYPPRFSRGLSIFSSMLMVNSFFIFQVWWKNLRRIVVQ